MQHGLCLPALTLSSLGGLAVAFILGTTEVQADVAYKPRIRLRAREHFEELVVYAAGEHGSYRSFTNTLDLWYEQPFRYAVGLAGSPLFAFLNGNQPPPGLGRTIRLVHLGAEAKIFPFWAGPHLYTRVGAYHAVLTSNGTLGTRQGKSELFGAGYEADLGGVGLALEMAWRWVQFDHGGHATGIAPAIGVHFYKAL